MNERELQYPSKAFLQRANKLVDDGATFSVSVQGGSIRRYWARRAIPPLIERFNGASPQYSILDGIVAPFAIAGLHSCIAYAFGRRYKVILEDSEKLLILFEPPT